MPVHAMPDGGTHVAGDTDHARVLFLVAEYSSRYSFMDLWPILLIVIGIVKLVESTAPTDGHISARNSAAMMTEATPKDASTNR